MRDSACIIFELKSTGQDELGKLQCEAYREGIERMSARHGPDEFDRRPVPGSGRRGEGTGALSAPLAATVALAVLGACAPEDPICPGIRYFSTLELRFAPADPSHEQRVAVYEDLNVDAMPDRLVGIGLENGVSYVMTVELALYCFGSATNSIRTAGTEYQLIFQGPGVAGPGSLSLDPVIVHEYSDSDAVGLPVGLANRIAARRSGSGSLSVTLLWLPTTAEEAGKTAGLAERIRDTEPADWPGLLEAQFELPLVVE